MHGWIEYNRNTVIHVIAINIDVSFRTLKFKQYKPQPSQPNAVTRNMGLV